MKTESAKVAKLIKAELKKNGIKCTAKSSNFSMGSSVTINVTNLAPWVMQDIVSKTDKYEYGTFDAMTDCQGFKNREYDCPQTKYLTINNSFTDDVVFGARAFVTSNLDCEQFSEHDLQRMTYDYLTGNSQLGCYFKKPVIKFVA